MLPHAEPTVSSPTAFASLPAWLDDPESIFALWIDTQPLEDSTKEVKEFMWGKWCRYLKEHSILLEFVEPDHLARFFKEEKIAKAQRQRYVKLVERVFAQLIFLGLSVKNPGTEAGFAKLGAGANDPTVFLEEEEIEKIEKIIRDRLAVATGAGQGSDKERKEKRRRGREKKTWVLARNAAVGAVMVGGGATVYAVGRLTVSCTKGHPGYISLPRKGGPDYLAPLTPRAHVALNAWLDYRATLDSTSELLFPADTVNRINRETQRDSAAMAPSSIFRAIRRLLADAGIIGARACGQTLRNTYAATLIRRGFDDAQLTEALGLYDLVSATRLRANWRIDHPE